MITTYRNIPVLETSNGYLIRVMLPSGCDEISPKNTNYIVYTNDIVWQELLSGQKGQYFACVRGITNLFKFIEDFGKQHNLKQFDNAESWKKIKGWH